MKCPFCSNLESKVTDSRLSAVGDVTRRRRECEKCARRFTTYERVEEVLPLVVKKDGRREMFDRVKLLGGLRRACDKREIGVERLEQVVDAIERDLIDSGEKEVRAQAVGEKVMNHLRTLDDIAYVRFASVYRSFRDIEEFRAELEKIAQDRAQAQSGRKPSSPPPSTPPGAAPAPTSERGSERGSDRTSERGTTPSSIPSSLPSTTPVSGVASVDISGNLRGAPHVPNAPSRPTPSENSAKDQPQ